MNPYEPPKRFDGVASSFGDKLLMSFLWVLMPMTMAYFSIRGHEKKVSLREELLMEAVCHLQWPIGWMCIFVYGVYLLVF